jgi:hypothetical protein
MTDILDVQIKKYRIYFVKLPCEQTQLGLKTLRRVGYSFTSRSFHAAISYLLHDVVIIDVLFI